MIHSIGNAAACLSLALLSACAQAPRIQPGPALSAGARAQAECAAAALPESAFVSATPYASGLPTQGQWRDGFELVDMDGDGHLDLLHGPPRKGRAQPVIFRGDGTGGFIFWSETHFPPLQYDYGDIKAADFNGDGRIDIALASHLRGLVTLIGEGNGFFAPWGEGLELRKLGQPSEQPLFSSRSIAVADWNRDGRPDLQALNEGPSLFAHDVRSSQPLLVFLNRGGYWERIESPPSPPPLSFGDALAIGDLNGDGQPDALTGTQMEGARALLQIGSPTGFTPNELRSLPKEAAVTAVALHDFDGDARDEMVYATRSVENGRYCTALHTVARDTAGVETVLTLWRTPSIDPVVAMDIADVNGDGHADVIAARQLGGMLVFVGQSGGFTRDLTIASPAGLDNCQIFDIGIADLDGDGSKELIAGYAGEDTNTGALHCAGNGGFASWRLRAIIDATARTGASGR